MQSSRGVSFLAAACLVAALLSLLSLFSCAPRDPHDTGILSGLLRTQRACIAGKVSDSLTGKEIREAKLEIEPPLAGMSIATDPGGFYYAEFNEGTYHLKFTKPGYRSVDRTVHMKRGESEGWDVSLEPTAPVVVTAGDTIVGATPDSTVTVRAQVIIRDGSNLKEIRWELHQNEGEAPVRLDSTAGAVVRVTLPGMDEYKKSLLYHLEKNGRLPDSWKTLGIVPADLREAGKVTIAAVATTTSGTYSGTVDILADLHALAEVNPGLRNVVTGKSLFLQGKHQPSYAWSLAAPPGSHAIIKGASTQNPNFVPDVEGIYTVREGNKERLTIYAGHWNGVVVAGEGEPRERWVGLRGCYCHSSGKIAAKFMGWRDSGHAEIFAQCTNTVFRYEERCFGCHSVGFGGSAFNGGITSVAGYAAFRKDPALWDAGKTPPIIRPTPANYDYIFSTYPDVSRLTNVQCENCHGPNNSKAHKTLSTTGAPERISLEPEVCGTCHDPSRGDQSYQMWYQSRHANYNLAIETGSIEKRGNAAGDCGRCHTGQGFLAWLARGGRGEPLNVINTDAGKKSAAGPRLSMDYVVPITCAICHDPHAAGNSFRSKNEKVPVRTVDVASVHPREFQGKSGGRGALCITCHSTTDGPHNDKTPGRPDSDLSPHSVQGDVLFGQNAFFIDAGAYQSHAGIEDTCIWCHVKAVPKSSDRGYPRGEVNHSFRTSSGICLGCHKEIVKEELMDATKRDLNNLKKLVEDALRTAMSANGSSIAHEPADIAFGKDDILAVSLVELQKEICAEITPKAGSVLKVPLAKLRPQGVPLAASENGRVMLKSAWNYYLVKNDGSQGIHNPRFVSEVLAATTGKVRALLR